MCCPFGGDGEGHTTWRNTVRRGNGCFGILLFRIIHWGLKSPVLLTAGAHLPCLPGGGPTERLPSAPRNQAEKRARGGQAGKVTL